MPYSPTSWVSGTTPMSAGNLNNLETQYTDAVTSFNQDLFVGFVLSGFGATKDSVTASQLDVAAGVAYLVQSDSTTLRTSLSSSTQSTSTPSSTYHLYLQPGGTWYWSTSNSPAANSLFIAQVTTDGSGNILAITDERNKYATMLPNGTGAVAFGNGVSGGMSIDSMGCAVGVAPQTPSAPTATPVSGSGLGVGVYGYKVTFLSFNGQSLPCTAATCTTTSVNKKVNLTAIPTGPTGVIARQLYRTTVGGSTYLALATINDNTTTTYSDTTADGSLGVSNPPSHGTMGAYMVNSRFGSLNAAIFGDGAVWFDAGTILTDGAGNLTITALNKVAGQLTVGSFGCPLIVSQSLLNHVTGTGVVGVISFTAGAAGLYEVSGSIIMDRVSGTGTVTLTAGWTDAFNGAQTMDLFGQTGTGSSPVILNAATLTNGVAYSVLPASFYASASTVISVNYTDSAGTPSDYVTLIVKRLA